MTAKLRVRLPIELGMQVLGRLLAEFAREHPGLDIELKLTDRFPDPCEAWLDVAVGIGPPPGKALASRKIASLGGGLYASPFYIEQHGEPRSAAALAAHPCLRYRTRADGEDWDIGRAPPQAKPRRPVVAVCANNLTVLREAAICGLGIARLPHILCGEALQANQLRRILIDCEVHEHEVFASWPDRSHFCAIVQHVLDHLGHRLAQLADGPGALACRPAANAASIGHS